MDLCARVYTFRRDVTQSFKTNRYEQFSNKEVLWTYHAKSNVSTPSHEPVEIYDKRSSLQNSVLLFDTNFCSYCICTS